MKDVTLAYVDAREHRAFANAHNVTCAETDCDYYVYKREYYDGRKPFKISPEDNFHALLSRVEVMGGHIVEPASVDMLEERDIGGGEFGYIVKNAELRSSGKHIVGFFQESDTKFTEAFSSVALNCMLKNKAQMTFHAVIGDNGLKNFPPPAVFISTPDGFNSWGPDNETKEEMVSETNETKISDTLERWIRSGMITPVMPYQRGQTDSDLDYLKIAALFLFIEDDMPIHDQTPDFLMELAANFFGRVAFVTAGIEMHADHLEDFGFDRSFTGKDKDTALPLIGIKTCFNQTNGGRDHRGGGGKSSSDPLLSGRNVNVDPHTCKKFLFKGNASDKQAVEWFINDVVRQKVTQHADVYF